MFKTELKFKDFLGNEKTATLRFNLSETELLDLTRDDPKLSPDFLAYVVAEQDVILMLDVIRKIIAVSYGILSEDGNHFRKPKEAVDDFLHSAMYEALLDQITSTGDAEYLKNFIIGVFPAKFAEELSKINTNELTGPVSIK